MGKLYYQVVPDQTDQPKYEVIRQSLANAILAGDYRASERLPSESQLVAQFAVSRPTVNRALRELQLAGLIDRRAGSGSFVRPDLAARGLSFGLLIPELGRTEIFEPICQGMAEARHAGRHFLLWGSQPGLETDIDLEQRAEQACRQLITAGVAGVFFAPLELTPRKDAINRGIAETLARAGITLVLLDRDLTPYPERSQYDLVGIDNRRAGYAITRHLLDAGCRTPVFIGRPDSAPTVDARAAGFREAVAAAGIVAAGLVCRIEPGDITAVRDVLDQRQPDGFVCANDYTAAQLLRSLIALQISVPGDIRMVGIDDVKYARLLSVPLTTIHQPCTNIGAVAIGTMLERLRDPRMPAREVLLNFELVVRESCGTRTTDRVTS